MDFQHCSSLETISKFFDQATALAVEIHQLTDELEILKTTVKETRKILECDRVIIYQFLPQEDGVIIAESVGNQWIPILGQLIYDPCFSEKWSGPYRLGKISIVEDIYAIQAESCYIELLERFQVRANLVVPILVGKQPEAKLWGLLIAQQCAQPRQWGSLEIKLLQNLAAQVGTALGKLEQFQEALKKSERRWQYALEGNGDGVWNWNVDRNQVFFSRRWKEMLGFSDAEIGNTLSEWEQRVHPDDKAQVYAKLEQHFRGETAYYISEHRVKCKDGTYKWILDRGQVLSHTIDGQPLRMIGTHTDITERKRIEEALRESEERYRSVIAAMTEGIVLQQADGKIIACNQSAEKILGLTQEQMTGCTSVDPRWRAIHEDGSPFLGENHPAMVTLKTGQPQTNAIMGVHKPDGQLIWISINSQPLFRPDDSQPYAVVTSFNDITEKRQLEVDLQKSEALFRGVFEQATVGAGLVNSSGKFLKVNQRFCNLVGYSQAELEQMNYAELTHPDDLKLSQKHHLQFWTKGVPFSMDKRYIRKDGEIQWVNLTASPIYNVQGELHCALGIVIDISERKQAESIILQQAQRERMINEIAQHIRESLDLERILQTIVTEVRQFLQTDRVIIYRFNPDWSGIVVSESVAHGFLAILRMEITDSYIVETQGGTYHEGKINDIPDIYQAGLNKCHIELLEKLQVRAKLVVPILQGSKTWGLLVAHHCSSPRKWQDFEVELLKQLAIQGAIAIQQAELNLSLELKNQELENLVLVDELTQIANRRCFEHDFNHEWQRLTHYQEPLSLLMCDIDYFKLYNDTYGHRAGDECLKRVAQTLQKVARRATDLVARYGGEEFVIILPQTNSYGATQVAIALKKALDQLQLPHLASRVAPYVTLSIGIATLIPTGEQTPLKLLDAADTALYQAKKEGRDRYCIYRPCVSQTL